MMRSISLACLPWQSSDRHVTWAGIENGVFIKAQNYRATPDRDHCRDDNDDDGDDHPDGGAVTPAFMPIVVVAHFTQPARRVSALYFN